MSQFVEAVGAADVRAAVWQDALERHAGNISRASKEFGFTKQRGYAITKRHGLVDLAAELKAKVGQKKTGRPSGSTPASPPPRQPRPAVTKTRKSPPPDPSKR